MDETRRSEGQATEAAPPGTKRPWEAPVLQRHEALTVLTQSVIGPGVPFLLQIGLSGGSGNRVFPGGAGSPALAPGGPARGGIPYHGPYPQ